MGAVFAGIVRAPITSIVIIFEMTNNYSVILPLMAANITSYAIARRLSSMPIYDALLMQDGTSTLRLPPPSGSCQVNVQCSRSRIKPTSTAGFLGSIATSVPYAQRGSEVHQDLPRALELRPRRPGDHPFHGRLDRARPGGVDTSAFLRDAQESPSAIPGIRPSPDEALPLETLEDSGQRARIDVQELGNLARGDARKPGHDADDQTLRARDADRRLHAFRRRLQGVIDSPDQPHELEHLA
jgi:hypothetical protein